MNVIVPLRYVMLLAFTLLLVACSGDDDAPNPTPTATPSPQPTVGITPMVLAMPTPFPMPIETPVPPAQREAKGLFDDPRPVNPARRLSLGTPVSPFTPPDGRTVMVYDLYTGREQRFEPGIAGAFSGDYFIYASEAHEAWLVDLRTGEKHSLGPNQGTPGFLGADAIWLNQETIYDISSHQAQTLKDLPDARRQEIERRIRDLSSTVSFDIKLKDGSVVRRVPVIGAQCAPNLQKFATCMARERRNILITDLQGKVLFHFKALQVQQGNPGEILLLTAPVCDDAGKQVDCIDFAERVAPADPYAMTSIRVEGTTNLFSVDLDSGAATFIATSRYAFSTRNMIGEVPLTSDDRYIIWTEGFCYDNGVTRIYDRQTRSITELDEAMLTQFAGGKMLAGPYFPQWLLEPGTWRRIATLPAENGYYYWSPDNHYVAAGTPPGKDGPCYF
jgi:hypothetical protein